MPAVKHQAPQLAELRRRTLSVLLANRPLIDSILNRPTREPVGDNRHLLDQTAELVAIVRQLHAADLADLLESLPHDERLALWRLVDNNKRGKTLVEASENVWESLIAEMSNRDILQAISPLDVDEQAYLARYLPRDLVGRVLTALEPHRRAQVREMMHFDRDSVGHHMDFELATVRSDVTLTTVQRWLRWRKKLPENSDKLFVVDRHNTLVGELTLSALLLNPLNRRVSEVMDAHPTTFHPDDRAEEAASAFERYDMITAPVIDSKGKLMGRLSIEQMVDLYFEESDSNLRRLGGSSPEEDIFAPVRKAVRTRWTWLAVNLCTAFIASRVIGLFDGTIAQLVSLAALMPIVAGIGGNTGNQTITMIVRAAALHQLEKGNAGFLILRELGVAIINGLVWGGIMGIVTWLLYGEAGLGGVMMLAMLLNLLLAALMGVLIPLLMIRIGHDPAVGSSVMITAITDTGGFFIFLGLATLFLIH
ncbi:magnesium transporter [Sodalis sp. (in: enterobacteria)]|uniref:magnesium transporter n=1 Tax=Sodalis sp. (in: enterobacteria) TaxID=1898979 RepID=UPI003F3C0793